MRKKILLSIVGVGAVSLLTLQTPIKNVVDNITTSKVTTNNLNNVGYPLQSTDVELTNTITDLIAGVERFLPSTTLTALSSSFPLIFSTTATPSLQIGAVNTLLNSASGTQGLFFKQIIATAQKLYPGIDTSKFSYGVNQNIPGTTQSSLCLTLDAKKDFNIVLNAFIDYATTNLNTTSGFNYLHPYSDPNQGFSQDLLNIMQSFFNILNSSAVGGAPLESMLNFDTTNASSLVQGISGKNPLLDNLVFGSLVSTQREYEIVTPGTPDVAAKQWNFSAQVFENYMNYPTWFNPNTKAGKDNDIYGFYKNITDSSNQGWSRFIDPATFFNNVIQDYRNFLDNIVKNEPSSNKTLQWATLFRTDKDHDSTDVLQKLSAFVTGVTPVAGDNDPTKVLNQISISSDPLTKGITQAAIYLVKGKPTSSDPNDKTTMAALYSNWANSAYKYDKGVFPPVYTPVNNSWIAWVVVPIVVVIVLAGIIFYGIKKHWFKFIEKPVDITKKRVNQYKTKQDNRKRDQKDNY